MTLLTGAEYIDSLRDGREVWMDGERVEDVTKHPAFAGMIKAAARMYDMQHEEAFQDQLTYVDEAGVRRSRFYKLPETHEDLVNRRHMTMSILNEVSSTMDRFGDETVTPLFVMHDRKDLLDKYDTRYHANVARWLDKLQRTNLFMSSANTDLKGDRSKQPFQQPDKDHYLRVVEEREDGIIVSGAKYETGASYAHVAFVKPTVGAWIPENTDFAVAFVVPMNAKGVKHICRAPLARNVDEFDRPLTAKFDEIDTLLVFENVFIPWEDVVFSRKPDLAAAIRADLTRWAAQGFLLRSLAKADTLVGAALLVSEQSRVDTVPQVKDRISKIMVYREALNAFILAAEAAAQRTISGLWMPNQAIQNAGRVYASTNYHHAVHDLRDVIGGSPIVVPSRKSLESNEIGPIVEKYFRIGNTGAENRMRAMNLACDLTNSAYAGRAQCYQIFAETPIFAQSMALYSTFDRDGAKMRAAKMAGIRE
ncbi:4-hydroxyphenylacetate 3-hydroxylase family protein [Seohaeicola zhoushanensis]|uniref:4-hydroxybutyryl-CoA dehydratase n=1 Tax=Seohaeicola zhoushanensis TaxID=1569283 RepID=A0A8J3H2P9_9RHOB|nr:4-hydroxyphenylacetate 3-hydroxylase N-terminal domain-containing protein [Seohaeicola zhoushanensis]GHF68861.1 4-hydroxybutyryl-CoA dehydratase [Seohaeicola zhoushanensis]